MASQVTIMGPGARRHVVKTAPGKYLNDILEEACAKFKLDAKQYGLKNNNKVVDLSRTMRLSGLTPGAKLELTLLSRSPSVVTVALQLPEAEAGGAANGRITDKFPSNTTLWMILRKFEAGVAGQAGQPKNFTMRGVAIGAAEGSGSGRLYHEAPVLQIMSREYTSMADLQKTLGQLGFNNGSVLLKLSFKTTDVPLEDAMRQMEAYFASVEPADQSQKEVVSEAETQEAEFSKPPNDVVMDDDNSEPLPQGSEGETATNPTSSNPPQTGNAEELPSSQSTAAPPGPEVIPGVSKRPTSVYAPPSSTTPLAARMTHNESDYIPTIDHAKSHQATLSKAGVNRRLPTDAELAAQEAAQKEKLAAVREVGIKIRFPDQSSVVTTFSNSDTAEDLFAYTRSLMANADAPFALQYTGPKGAKVLSPADAVTKEQKLIGDLGMMNRVLVVVVWEDGASAEARRGPSLRPEVVEKQRQIEIQEIKAASADTDNDESGEGGMGAAAQEMKKERDGMGKERGKGGMPKWLKLPGKK